MNIPITNPSRELEKIRDFKTRINREISQGIYIGGNNVNKFENNLRKFLNCKYVVTLNSGTDALYLSLVAMKLKKNDEVLLPSFTFFATVECVLNVSPTHKNRISLDIKIRQKVNGRKIIRLILKPTENSRLLKCFPFSTRSELAVGKRTEYPSPLRDFIVEGIFDATS